MGRVLIGTIIILLGLSFLFDIDFGKYLWPVLLIVVGLTLLFGGFSNNWGERTISGTSHEAQLDYSSVFSSLDKKIETDNFKGGKVDVVFGGGTLDLRNAKIAKGTTAKLEVNAVFGGIKIIVPSSWAVNSSVTGVFGGFGNNTEYPKEGKEQGRLLLKGASVFGGGEVTN